MSNDWMTGKADRDVRWQWDQPVEVKPPAYPPRPVREKRCYLVYSSRPHNVIGFFWDYTPKGAIRQAGEPGAKAKACVKASERDRKAAGLDW